MLNLRAFITRAVRLKRALKPSPAHIVMLRNTDEDERKRKMNMRIKKEKEEEEEEEEEEEHGGRGDVESSCR
eukprot:SAG11_NODE_10918_length_796_cov_1.586801_2_plen_71_part_01